MKNIVIGIEGYVGAGKSAICEELLKYIPNSTILEGGNLYRTIVYALLKTQSNLEVLKKEMNNIDIVSMMNKLNVEIKIENRKTVTYLEGNRINEEDIQSAKSSIAVSEIATVANNECLYIWARNLIDELKEQYNVIVSGRDLVRIYPNLDYHFLIAASLEERIRRKNIKYNGKVDLEELRNNIIKRDELQEKTGFYKKYDKTITVDVTNCKTIAESTKEVLKYIK